MKSVLKFLLIGLTVFLYSCHSHLLTSKTPNASLIITHDQLADRNFDQLSNDLEKTSFLREQIASTCDLSLNRNSYCLDSSIANWEELPISNILDLFRKDSVTALCQNTASLLHDLYSQHGFESYIIYMAQSELPISHVATIVKIHYNGNDFFIVQDPYFNHFLGTPESEPIDFQLFLKPNKKVFKSLRFIRTKVTTDVIIPFNPDLNSLALMFKKDPGEFELIGSGKKIKFQTERNIQNMMSKYNPHYDRLFEKIKENNLLPSLFSWYLIDLEVHHPDRSERRLHIQEFYGSE